MTQPNPLIELNDALRAHLDLGRTWRETDWGFLIGFEDVTVSAYRAYVHHRPDGRVSVRQAYHDPEMFNVRLTEDELLDVMRSLTDHSEWDVVTPSRKSKRTHAHPIHWLTWLASLVLGAGGTFGAAALVAVIV